MSWPPGKPDIQRHRGANTKQWREMNALRSGPGGGAIWATEKAGSVSSPHRRHQRGGTKDSDCPFQVVGEDVEAHLGSDGSQPSRSEMGPPHPVLARAEEQIFYSRN